MLRYSFSHPETSEDAEESTAVGGILWHEVHSLLVS